MMLRTFVALLASLSVMLVPVRTIAAEAGENAQPKQAVGLSAGWVIANGLSYRRYLGDSYLQGTFAGMIDKQEQQEYLDLSLSFGSYLNTIDFAKGRYPVGVKIVGGIEAEHNRQGRGWDGVSTGTTHYIHTGLGFGLDMGRPRQRGLVISLDTVYTVSLLGFRARKFDRLGLLPSASIHYNM